MCASSTKKKAISNDDFLIAEFNSLRNEILDNLKLRTEYEILAYTILLALVGISIYYGYSVVIMLFIEILLFPLVLMITHLARNAVIIGSYLGARIQVDKATKKLPWEYLKFKEHGKKRRRTHYSAHTYILILPAIIAFIYLIFLVIFSDVFVSLFAENATWDIIYAKIVVFALSVILLMANIYAAIDNSRIDRIRLRKFNEFKEALETLQD